MVSLCKAHTSFNANEHIKFLIERILPCWTSHRATRSAHTSTLLTPPVRRLGHTSSIPCCTDTEGQPLQRKGKSDADLFLPPCHPAKTVRRTRAAQPSLDWPLARNDQGLQATARRTPSTGRHAAVERGARLRGLVGSTDTPDLSSALDLLARRHCRITL